MAKQNDNGTEEYVGTQEEGIRATVSKEVAQWLEEMSTASGLSKGQLINAAIAYFKLNGKAELAEAIMANAQSKVDKLLKG